MPRVQKGPKVPTFARGLMPLDERRGRPNISGRDWTKNKFVKPIKKIPKGTIPIWNRITARIGGTAAYQLRNKLETRFKRILGLRAAETVPTILRRGRTEPTYYITLSDSESRPSKIRLEIIDPKMIEGLEYLYSYKRPTAAK